MTYSPERRKEIQDRVCRDIAKGMSLVRICQASDMPAYETIRAWLADDREFSVRYACAREDQADYIADQILEIADTAEDANKARVQIDSRKWLAGKLKAKVYGDKINIDQNVNVTVTPEQRAARIQQLIGKADAGLISIDGLRARRAAEALGGGGEVQGQDKAV